MADLGVSFSETEALRKGLNKVQQAVFKRLYTTLAGVCGRYTVDTMQAEDAVTTAFIKAFGSMDSFVWQHKGSFYAWIRRIAIREVLNELRSSRAYLSIEDIHDRAIESDDQHTYKLDANKAMEMLNALPLAQKVVFLLIQIESCSHAEAATLLGISEANSKQLLHRARMRLRAWMSKVNNSNHGKLGT
jgi:RNA polymerase sigma factor (sigma-70 family)